MGFRNCWGWRGEDTGRAQAQVRFKSPAPELAVRTVILWHC